MCLGCAELARGSSLSRGQLADLKERFHSAFSKTSSMGFAPSTGGEQAPKPYDGDNYFERQNYSGKGQTGDRYNSNEIVSYKDRKESYSKAA